MSKINSTVRLKKDSGKTREQLIGELAALRQRVAELEESEAEREQAEEALRESEERYRALFDSTNDIVQSVALDGSFIFVNKAWFQTLGYTKAELPNLNMFNIIHPESLEHCQELFARVMAGESVHNIQVTFISKDGRNIQVEGSASPRIIGGSVMATQGFFRDVNERQKNGGTAHRY